MSVAEALALDGLRLELEALVDLLVLEDKCRLDDGRLASSFALLDAVEDAATARTRSGQASPASQRSPLGLGALELLCDVEAVTGAHRRVGRSRAGAVRAWAVAVSSTGSFDDLADAVEVVNRWTTRARALLDPPRTLPLRGAACPQCGARDVVEDGTAGERIVNPALVADLRAGRVGCRAADCEAEWPAEHLHLLAEHLDRQTLAEVLAVE